jgi:hypothetical protein
MGIGARGALNGVLARTAAGMVVSARGSQEEEQ